MALLLPNSIFFHIPKTGGIWVRETIFQNNLAVAEINCEKHKKCLWKSLDHMPQCCLHVIPNKIPPEIFETRFAFAFVRHPYSYYRSYWSFMERFGFWKPHNFSFVRECRRFDTFIKTITSRQPGWLTNIYKRFGCLPSKHYRPLDFVGKQEFLADDLILALKMAGEIFEESKIKSLEPQNVMPADSKWKKEANITPELARLIQQSEKEIFQYFKYPAEIN